MKILDIPQSGRQGTFVSVQTRYGQVRRRCAVPKDPRSPAQLRIRSAFGRVVSKWRALMEDQRAAWAVPAHDVYSRPRLGQSGRLSGYLLFVKINSTLAYQGQALVVIPPERPTFDANPVGPLVATNTGGGIDLKLSVPSATPKLLWRAGRIITRIYHPLSNGMQMECFNVPDWTGSAGRIFGAWLPFGP